MHFLKVPTFVVPFCHWLVSASNLIFPLIFTFIAIVAVVATDAVPLFCDCSLYLIAWIILIRYRNNSVAIFFLRPSKSNSFVRQPIEIGRVLLLIFLFIQHLFFSFTVGPKMSRLSILYACLFFLFIYFSWLVFTRDNILQK